MIQSITICLALAAVIAPWPMLLGGGVPLGLPADASDTVIASDSDVYDAAWHFWWVGRAVASGGDPMFCDMIYHPRGASLSLHNIGWTSTLALSALSLDPVMSLNVALLFGTILTFAAGVLLARHWGAEWDGAFLTGMITALMPSRVGHLYQHYMVAQIGWAMLALLFFARYLKRGRGLVPIGLFTLLATFESFYHLLIIIPGAFAVAILQKEGRTLRRVLGAASAIALGMVIAALWFIPRHGSAIPSGMNWREAVHWSAEPASYLMPSPYGLAGLLFGLPLSQSWMPNAFEGNVTCGLSVVLVFAAVCLRTKRPVFGIIALFIMILSFGPLLKLGGIPTAVPLPWMLPAKIPLLANARVPARISMLFGVAAAVVTGVALRGLRPCFRLSLAAIIVFELFIPVFPTVSRAVPAACREAQGPVLDLPASAMIRVTALYQTLHQRPRLTAFLARGGDTAIEATGLSGLMMGDSNMVTDGLLRSTNAGTAFYHRMLLAPLQRAFYDSIYAPAFPGGTPSDSVWVWHR